MSGAKKTFKKITSGKNIKKRFFPTKKDDLKESFTSNPLRAIPDSIEDLGEAFTPEIPVPPEETIIPIPDESLAATEARKRRAKSSRTGRQSTILTEGLGG